MPKKSSSNKITLFLLAGVMIINALSYGTIIPLLYPYASRFGIGPLQLSFLFSAYSLFQLLATPLIGRLSDVYGRKPLLLLCLAGTSLSLALFASAQSAAMLFVSRILDGITGGNNSVAQAIIADTTTGKERAQAFGVLGAAFGVGFLVGPALGGIMSQISLTAPFWFAAGLALIGTLAGVFFLPETLHKSKRERNDSPIITPGQVWAAFFYPAIGIVLSLSLVTTIAQQVFVIGFQAFSVDILQMSARNIGITFALFGLVSIIMQMAGIKWVLQLFDSKRKVIQWALILSAVAMVALWAWQGMVQFIVICMVYAVVFAPIGVLLPALISERSKKEDQGGMLGINQSVMSLGQIIGPLVAGFVASRAGVPAVFLVAALTFLIGIVMSFGTFTRKNKAFDL